MSRFKKISNNEKLYVEEEKSLIELIEDLKNNFDFLIEDLNDLKNSIDNYSEDLEFKVELINTFESINSQIQPIISFDELVGEIYSSLKNQIDTQEQDKVFITQYQNDENQNIEQEKVDKRDFPTFEDIDFFNFS
jgi:hypothetical protein